MRWIGLLAIAPVGLLAAFSQTPAISVQGNQISPANRQQVTAKLPNQNSEILAQAGASASLSAFEKGIIDETNLARKNPAAYAAQMQKIRQYYKGNRFELPGQIPILTQEGVKAVDEAINYLKSAKPLPPITASRGMSLGARDHVKDQGPKGATGHNGSNGSKPWDRINKYGAWQKVVGENISYGPDDARKVVMQLIIDDGVPDRGHRVNIFKPDFRVSGVACGPHKKYRTMCVITYAGGYAEKR